MELDLLVDDIVDELPLDDKLGIKILEIPYFFGINNRPALHVRCDVLVIVPAAGTGSRPVFGKRPRIDREEKGIQLRHRVLLGAVRK